MLYLHLTFKDQSDFSTTVHAGRMARFKQRPSGRDILNQKGDFFFFWSNLGQKVKEALQRAVAPTGGDLGRSTGASPPRSTSAPSHWNKERAAATFTTRGGGQITMIDHPSCA